jgi:hypothetical protein
LDLKPISKELNLKEQYSIIDEILKQDSQKIVHKMEKIEKPTIMTNFFKHLEKKNIDPSVNVSSTKKNRKSKFLAFYCDYVGYDKLGIYDSLARITIVNEFGDLIYQKEIKQKQKVTDFRKTGISNISPSAISEEEAIKEIEKLIGTSKLIGFENKLPFKMNDISKLSKKSLEEMSKLHLGVEIRLSTTAVDKCNIVLKLFQINKF